MTQNFVIMPTKVCYTPYNCHPLPLILAESFKSTIWDKLKTRKFEENVFSFIFLAIKFYEHKSFYLFFPFAILGLRFYKPSFSPSKQKNEKRLLFVKDLRGFKTVLQHDNFSILSRLGKVVIAIKIILSIVSRSRQISFLALE